ncbi:MAG: addiction module antidote protein, HigA family [Pseudomonadota bacterium]
MAIKLHPSFAVHPGQWLRMEMVEPHGLSVADAAAKLRVTRQAMSNSLGGRAGQAVGENGDQVRAGNRLSADTLMRMQAAHDLARVRAEGCVIGGAGVGLILPPIGIIKVVLAFRTFVAKHNSASHC